MRIPTLLGNSVHKQLLFINELSKIRFRLQKKHASHMLFVIGVMKYLTSPRNLDTFSYMI